MRLPHCSHRHLLLLVASLSLALAAAEKLAFEYEHRAGRFPVVGNQFRLMRYDQLLGWSLIPGISRKFQRHEFDTTVTTNSMGLRDHEIGPKQGYRVAILGDSFTWGYGVEASERFSDLLALKTGVETINFGLSGYGTIQYYLMLDRVLSLKPDLVIIAFCLQNDFDDSINSYRYGRYKPYAALDNGKLDIRGLPPHETVFGPEIYPWYRRYSALLRLTLRAVGVLRDNMYKPPPDNPPVQGITNLIADAIYYYPNDPTVREALKINELLLAGIKQKLDAAGVQMLLFALPTKMELGNGTAQRLLREQAQALSIPYIERPEPIPAEGFFVIDQHWNARGHALAAQLLAGRVEEIRAKSGK